MRSETSSGTTASSRTCAVLEPLPSVCVERPAPRQGIAVDTAWQSRAGIRAISGGGGSVPEPATLLFALAGLALLPRRRRKG